MEETNDGGNSAATPQEGRQADDAIEELDAQWKNLEQGLTAYLSTMLDPDEEDHLIIELAGHDPDCDEGTLPYVQFAGFDDGRQIRAEIVGDVHLPPQYHLNGDASEFLTLVGWSGNGSVTEGEGEKNWYVERPVAAAGEIAAQVISTLRSFGIAHPQLLTHRAWGPAAEGVEVLGLCATDDVPTDEPRPPAVSMTLRDDESVMSTMAFKPIDRDDLVGLVERLLREKYDEEPTVDEDGDFVLDLGQPVYVRVRGDQPAVEIFARVAHDVHSRRATAVEIGLLNRDHSWVKWTLIDRSICQSLLVPARPFAPKHLSVMLEMFVAALAETRDDLAYRLGAKVA